MSPPHLQLTNNLFVNNYIYIFIYKLLWKCTTVLTLIVFSCRWKLNNAIIDLNEKGSHYSLAGGNLVISNPIKTKHEGKYSCLATNMYGTVVSQEGSVQFGCKWPKCKTAISDGIVPWGFNRELPWSCTFMHIKRFEIARAAGTNYKWCGKGNFWMV